MIEGFFASELGRLKRNALQMEEVYSQIRAIGFDLYTFDCGLRLVALPRVERKIRPDGTLEFTEGDKNDIYPIIEQENTDYSHQTLIQSYHPDKTAREIKVSIVEDGRKKAARIMDSYVARGLAPFTSCEGKNEFSPDSLESALEGRIPVINVFD